MTLLELAASHGYTLERAAVELECDTMLLVRVDQGRQPCPMLVVRALALLWGEEVGTVEVACVHVVDTNHPTAFRAHGPRPELGDPV